MRAKKMAELQQHLTSKAHCARKDLAWFKGTAVGHVLQEKYVTDRLIIRKPILNDAQEVFEKYAQSIEVTQWLTWKPHTSKYMTEKFINWCIDQWNKGQCFPFTICLKKTNELNELAGYKQTTATNCHANCKATFNSALLSPQRLFHYNVSDNLLEDICLKNTRHEDRKTNKNHAFEYIN